MNVNNESVNLEYSESIYPNINRFQLLLFCGYVFCWYLQIGYRITALGDLRFEFIYATALTLLTFFTPKLDLTCPLLPYILLYFIALVIQIPFSHDFDTSWNVFVDRIIKFAFMSFFIISFVRSPTHLKYFLAAFLLACLKMGQEGLVGRITGSLIWENQGIMRLHGSTPLYIHPNSFSGMALGTLPFVYYLWPICNKYYKTIFFLIGILSLNIIVYSGSRTAYVGVMAFVVFAYITSDKKRKFLFYLFLLLVILIPLIPGDYSERFDSIFTQKDKEGHSSEARIEILKDAWQIFGEHPFGIGIAAFPKVRMEKFERSQDTHNLYMEIATNLGIQGFLVVMVLFFKMYVLLKEIYKRADSAISFLMSSSVDSYKLVSDLVFIKTISQATGAFLIIRLALGLFGMDLYEIYWWFTIGITFALYSMMNRIDYFIDNKYSTSV